MRRAMIVTMLLAAVAVWGADAYNAGIQAYNKGDHAAAEKVLREYVAAGGKQPMAFIVLGQIEKGKGEHAKAADHYERAAELGKGKNRCTGLRCLIYSLTKAWGAKAIPRGDRAVKALEKEYPKDGDARVAVATWANRRGYELMKAKKFADAIPWLEKAVAARLDYMLFANNLAVCYCALAEGAEGKESRELALKAIAVLKRWEGKRDPKLDATRARAKKIR